jgi:Acetyltransferases
MSDRRYPDTTVGGFQTPPVSFDDYDGRPIRVERSDGSETTFESLVKMYDLFDTSDRAQGIPPVTESQIRDWLDTILGDGCFNVIAWHDDEVVGHATLVPDDDDYELAIFVLQSHQEAGIGTQLITNVLGYGHQNGAERVWLSVERWNKPAIGLYEQVGFETSDSENFELRMAIRLQESET